MNKEVKGNAVKDNAVKDDAVNVDSQTRIVRLEDLINEIESAFEDRDYSKVRSLINEDILVAWFGFSVDRLVEIMTVVTQQQPHIKDFLNYFYDYILSLGGEPRSAVEHTNLADFYPQLAWMNDLAQIFSLRLKGRTKEAYETLLKRKSLTIQMSPIFEKFAGEPIFLNIQDGLTAMVAGDVQFALLKFKEASMREAPARYSFLRRDALSKAAVVHAVFGDQNQTKNLIQAAEAVYISSSWVEDLVQTQLELAKISLTADKNEAIARLAKIKMQDIGEIWPYYILILQNVYELAGRKRDGERLIAGLEQFPLAKVPGQGLTGSVFGIVKAKNALHSGDGIEARRLISSLDQNIVPVKITAAMVEIFTGRPSKGIEALMGMRAEVDYLRRLSIRRLAYLSAGFYFQEDTEKCLETLKHTIKEYPDLSHEEVLHFLPEVHDLAKKELLNWPNISVNSEDVVVPKRIIAQQLTGREIEILKLLSKDLTRAQISEKLFISQNTVKSQTSAVYRKLGVSNKLAAIFEAERRGLLE